MLGLGPLFAASSVPALTPALPNIDMTRWLAANNNTPIVKRIEEGLGIDIPDEWEQRGNQLMRDFGNSSFGQWLVGGSWGSKILMGLLAFMLFDGIKDRLIGNDMGTNMLSLSVGVLAAQMLPELLKAMTEQPAAPAEELLRPQALDFAPSNSGAALGGMSFAPAP
jgi:hypothetical protein